MLGHRGADLADHLRVVAGVQFCGEPFLQQRDPQFGQAHAVHVDAGRVDSVQRLTAPDGQRLAEPASDLAW